MNQEGQKADPTRSKWLHRVVVTKLAAALVEGSPHLRDNVDTVRDRLSKRNPRLCAFNTLSRAFEEYWPEVNHEDKSSLDMEAAYLLQYWDKLVQIRPELGKLDLRGRQSVRENSLVDSALAITAYIARAKVLKEGGIGLAALERPSRAGGILRQWQTRRFLFAQESNLGKNWSSRSGHQAQREQGP